MDSDDFLDGMGMDQPMDKFMNEIYRLLKNMSEKDMDDFKNFIAESDGVDVANVELRIEEFKKNLREEFGDLEDMYDSIEIKFVNFDNDEDFILKHLKDDLDYLVSEERYEEAAKLKKEIEDIEKKK